MPKTRFQKLAPDAQRRILDAARAEFVRHGYDGASINQIIQAAGINKGSLYYYFEDKADLFLTVMLDAQAEMIRSVAELDLDKLLRDPPQDFWGFMERAALQKIAFAVHHPDLMRLGSELFRQASRPGAPARLKEYMQRDVQDMLCEFLRMGQAQGAVRQDIPLATLAELSQATSEIMNRALMDDPSRLEGYGPEELREYSRLQVDMMQRMLAVPKGGTPQ